MLGKLYLQFIGLQLAAACPLGCATEKGQLFYSRFFVYLPCSIDTYISLVFISCSKQQHYIRLIEKLEKT